MALTADPPTAPVRQAVADAGTLRQAELVERTGLAPATVRAALDELVLAGTVERFPVGNHLMLKWTGGENGDR